METAELPVDIYDAPGTCCPASYATLSLDTFMITWELQRLQKHYRHFYLNKVQNPTFFFTLNIFFFYKRNTFAVKKYDWDDCILSPLWSDLPILPVPGSVAADWYIRRQPREERQEMERRRLMLVLSFGKVPPSLQALPLSSLTCLGASQ